MSRKPSLCSPLHVSLLPLRIAGWIAVALVVAAVTAARVALFSAGPDIDSDSYGHAVIGRTLLLAPTDVRQHWVWLPLWQYVFMVLAMVGRGLDEVRLTNVALAALTPILLTRALEVGLARPQARAPRWRQGVDAVVPFFAGVLACLWPLVIDHGQSGEPEPLFATLLVGACLAVETGRAWLAGVVLAVACLLRYEAWAVLPAFFVAAAMRARASGRWLAESSAWIVPALAIAAWIVVHERATGEWLQFVRINREFSRGARATAIPGVGPQPTLWWYAATLPRGNLGAAALLAIPGAIWLFRRAPLTIGLAGTTLLAFVTYGWVREQHLGLDRHFYAIAPFYSVAVAAGFAELLSLAARFAPRPFARIPSRALIYGHLALCGWIGVRTLRYFAVPELDRMLRVHAEAWQNERTAADLVRLGQPARVFCDLPRVEVFSKLPPDRFVRWSVADVEPLHADGEAQVFGRAFLVSRPDHFTKLDGRGTPILDKPDVRVVEWSK